jgi:hypothetical protein
LFGTGVGVAKELFANGLDPPWFIKGLELVANGLLTGLGVLLLEANGF